MQAAHAHNVFVGVTNLSRRKGSRAGRRRADEHVQVKLREELLERDKSCAGAPREGCQGKLSDCSASLASDGTNSK